MAKVTELILQKIF